MARLLSLRSLRVSGEEVPQHHQKLARALFVAATERVMDFVAHHVANPLRSVWFFQQVAPNGCGCNFRYVFVLCDGQHLLFGEATKSNTILKADHAEPHVDEC